jgi:hypothetical protein
VETFERYGASCSVPNQALQLVTPVCWDVGVGVQRKPMDTGTAGACECGVFPFIPKARANPSHLLSGPLTKGKTLKQRSSRLNQPRLCFRPVRARSRGPAASSRGAWARWGLRAAGQGGRGDAGGGKGRLNFLYSRIRVIVVDDCSTDQTPAVLRRFQEWLDVSFGGGKFEWQFLRHKHNFISST